MTAARQAFVGAGANLGRRLATLAAAMAELRATPGVNGLECSGFYETEPVGGVVQPLFLNLVAGIETTLTPETLLERLLAIEATHGRVRTTRWGPRTLDLDLLAFEGETRATATLTLPHPRMMERAFVLVPLRELLEAPRFRGPCWADLRALVAGWHSADSVGVRRYTAPATEKPA